MLVAGLYRDVWSACTERYEVGLSVGQWGSTQGDQTHPHEGGRSLVVDRVSTCTWGVLTLTAMMLVAGLYRDVWGRPVSGPVGMSTG